MAGLRLRLRHHKLVPGFGWCSRHLPSDFCVGCLWLRNFSNIARRKKRPTTEKRRWKTPNNAAKQVEKRPYTMQNIHRNWEKTRKTTTEMKLYWMRIRTQVKCEPICSKHCRRGRQRGRMGRWLNLFAAINEISTRLRNSKRIPVLVGPGRNEFDRNNVEQFLL